MKSMFGVLVTSYVVRTVFLYMQGHFTLVVKSMHWRTELEYVTWTLFDLMAIVPILMMHRKNFGTTQQ